MVEWLGNQVSVRPVGGTDLLIVSWHDHTGEFAGVRVLDTVELDRVQAAAAEATVRRRRYPAAAVELDALLRAVLNG